MQGFIFKPGDVLLDGYTVENPLGHGGFGEVYHAKSAAGKDVALKLIQRFLEIELRGVGHCLNLKHPHLVTIYDVRPDSDGRQWIVMEYVAGESLSDAIEQHPDGMPVEAAFRWFEPICQAVEHLHQSGIVHRDLKPGNIFDDRGTVKVGDYGLAKFITASKRSAQTQSVGTLHYMAPEVGSGRYGREVDVYAVGVILYEMLTGRVPFEGESAAEILMKHLTSPPDLDKLPVAFRGVVARMLAKNPNDRYGSVLSALNDLKVKIADHAHGEAIGEPSQYPAYEAAVVSRPGMSDWLEAPLGWLGALDDPTKAAPASRGAAHRSGGQISAILRRRPLLSAFCSFLLLLAIIGTFLSLFEIEHYQRGSRFLPQDVPWQLLAVLCSAAPAASVAIFGYLLRSGSRDEPVRDAWRRHPLLTGFAAVLMFLPLVGALRLIPGSEAVGNWTTWLLLVALVPGALVATIGFLMRTDSDEAIVGESQAERFAPVREPTRAGHVARTPRPEFAPTIIAAEAAGGPHAAAHAHRGPRDPDLVLSELDELDREWEDYRDANLQRNRDGSFIVPSVDESRAALIVGAGFCALLASGAVIGIVVTDAMGLFGLLLAATLVLAIVVVLPLIRDLRVAHVYARSVRRYRMLRQRLVRELPPDQRHGARPDRPTDAISVRRLEDAPAGVTASAVPRELVAELELHIARSSNSRILRAVGVLLWVAVGTAGVALALGHFDLTPVLVVTGGVVLITILIGLVIRGRRRAAFGLLVLLAAAAGLMMTSDSTVVRHATPVESVSREAPGPNQAGGGNQAPGGNQAGGENQAPRKSATAVELTGDDHAAPSGLELRWLRPAGWNIFDESESGLLRVRFERPDGKAAIEVRQVDEMDTAQARSAAISEVSTDGAFVVARQLHQQLAARVRDEFAERGFANYSRESTRIQPRSPAGGVFIDEFYAMRAADGELVQGVWATWYDGEVALQVTLYADDLSHPLLASLLQTVLDSIEVNRAG